VWIDAKSNVHPIHSSTDGLEGHVELEVDDQGQVAPTRPASGELSLRVNLLSSGNRMEDRELQRRIDARRYPTISGVMKGIETDGADGSYQVSGDVTFRGVARSYTDGMTVKAVDDQTVKLAGSSRFDIRDFGMEPPRMLMLKVEPEVTVRVEITAVKEV
jgi:polyisoprenoid-binding protein YceI